MSYVVWGGCRGARDYSERFKKKNKVGEFRISKEAEISKKIQNTYFMSIGFRLFIYRLKGDRGRRKHQYTHKKEH